MLFPPLDDMNWNALEWDRAAEELTWERVSLIDVAHPPTLVYPSMLTLQKMIFFLSVQMLGLDGSLVFLVGISNK